VPGKNASSGSISRQRLRIPNPRPKIAPPSPRNLQPRTSNAQISNRQCIRLETTVNLRKQTPPISSNREKEARPQDFVRAGPPGRRSGVALGFGSTGTPACVRLNDSRILASSKLHWPFYYPHRMREKRNKNRNRPPPKV